MASKKRPSILQRADMLRADDRSSVIIPGKYQVAEREVEEVLVTDLGASGCRLRASSVGVTKVEPIRLWLGDVGPITARLKWMKQGSLGLVFEEPLDADILEALLASPMSPAPSNVVPLRKRSPS